jgi:hypothetical protein
MVSFYRQNTRIFVNVGSFAVLLFLKRADIFSASVAGNDI